MFVFPLGVLTESEQCICLKKNRTNIQIFSVTNCSICHVLMAFSLSNENRLSSSYSRVLRSIFLYLMLSANIGNHNLSLLFAGATIQQSLLHHNHPSVCLSQLLAYAAPRQFERTMHSRFNLERPLRSGLMYNVRIFTAYQFISASSSLPNGDHKRCLIY